MAEMKQSLEWHRACASNAARQLASEEAALAGYVARQTAEIDRQRARLETRLAQIAEAERRGMDSFDADKLLVRRE